MPMGGYLSLCLKRYTSFFYSSILFQQMLNVKRFISIC